MAAAALAVGWAASDGRALGYATSLMHTTETRVAAVVRPAPIRQTSLRPSSGTDNESRPAASDRRVAAVPKPAAVVPMHVASIAPSPAPRLPTMRAAPAPETAVEPRRLEALQPPPLRAPVLPPMAERTPPPAAITTATAPAGGMRHATRLLVMRDRPDETGKHIGSVVSGMQVEVLKAEGHWRYVRADRDEGWVDGSFLAGESTALLTPVSRSTLAAVPVASSPRLADSMPMPPMAISSR